MKNKSTTPVLSFFILLILIMGSTMGITLQNTNPDTYVVSDFIDINDIDILQWYAPNGELPGTYEEYVQKRPRESCMFSGKIYATNTNERIGASNISILIDQELYPNIIDALNQYIEDLEHEQVGNTVYVETVQGGSPEEIKNWVLNRYNAHCDGIVFIGDITAAWADLDGSVFPCDLFYMDLDGEWIDADVDGDYESHTAGLGDMGPEIYVGRMYAHTLYYAAEEKLVNDYLSKVHDYRTGVLTKPWRGLEYVEEDWYSMEVYMNNIFGDDVTRYDSGYHTTGADYLNQMDLEWHSVTVCAHSYSGGHHFGRRPTESATYAHTYVYSPVNRDVKLLLGCDDGIKVWLNGNNVYTNDRYGGWNPDEFEVDVTLNAGWNRLLCKLSQGGGEYRFSARFTDDMYNAFPDLEYQLNNPDLYGEEGQFISGWLVNGFHQDISDNFWSYLTTNYLEVDEATINPNNGDEMGGFTWDLYHSDGSYVDLNDLSGGADYGVYYAFIRVDADTLKNCQLWMGYDDGARVWLNGVEVLNDNRYGGYVSDMTKLNVTLQSGENRLLVKISEWTGGHGFSARFCNDDGSLVEGLSYDPIPTPINYIGKWLTNGVYFNPDEATRLSTNYLGNETTIQPSQGYPAPEESWVQSVGYGYPFDLVALYDHGDWVYSSDVQQRDAPVLFYNLFACGPGRFTDDNYLAGSYIFNTSYSLISLASSKSGSMLAFADYTEPLGDGKRFGEAFQDWFDAQAPYENWEKDWYYGMIMFGDPTLAIEPHMEVPFAEFSVEPVQANISEVVYFNSSSYDYDGYIVNWSWDFDDGTFGYEEFSTHIYGDNGSYNVSLTVRDNEGITDTSYQVIQIGPSGFIDINQSVFDRGFPIRHAADGDWAAAQNFTTSQNILTKVQIYLRKFGNPEFDLKVELRKDHPQGTLLDTITFTPSEIASSWQWLTIDFDDVDVEQDMDIFIVCPPAPSGVTTSFGYEWGYAFGNQYDDGSFWFTRDGGTLWRDLPTSYEFVFKTYGYD